MNVLVQIETNDFSALATNFNDLPAGKTLALLRETDPNQQFFLVIELLRTALSPESVEAFEELTLHQVKNVVENWLERSGSIVGE